MGARKMMAAGAAAALLLGAAPASAQWAMREEGGRAEAGTLVDGSFAGLRLACAEPGRFELALTHNGATFERGRDYTASISVDGTATLLTVRARPSGRPGDDDLVQSGPAASIEPLLVSLSRGSTLEISAPSGRYALGLSGSSRAIAALRDAC